MLYIQGQYPDSDEQRNAGVSGHRLYRIQSKPSQTCSAQPPLFAFTYNSISAHTYLAVWIIYEAYWYSNCSYTCIKFNCQSPLMHLYPYIPIFIVVGPTFRLRLHGSTRDIAWSQQLSCTQKTLENDYLMQIKYLTVNPDVIHKFKPSCCNSAFLPVTNWNFCRAQEKWAYRQRQKYVGCTC